MGKIAKINIAKELEELKAEREKLLSGLDYRFKTGSNTVDDIEIQKCENLSDLIKLASHTFIMKSAYEQAATSLGLTTYPEYKAGDDAQYNAEDIKEDIEARINLITSKDRLAQVEALIKDFEAEMSREDRLEIAMAKKQALVQPGGNNLIG